MNAFTQRIQSGCYPIHAMHYCRYTYQWQCAYYGLNFGWRAAETAALPQPSVHPSEPWTRAVSVVNRESGPPAARPAPPRPGSLTCRMQMCPIFEKPCDFSRLAKTQPKGTGRTEGCGSVAESAARQPPVSVSLRLVGVSGKGKTHFKRPTKIVDFVDISRENRFAVDTLALAIGGWDVTERDGLDGKGRDGM